MTRKPLNQVGFQTWLAQRARRAGGWRALARDLGVAVTTLSEIRAGRDQPGPGLLAKLGLRRAVTVRYVPLTPPDVRAGDPPTTPNLNGGTE